MYRCSRVRHLWDDDFGKRQPFDDCLDSCDGRSFGTLRGPAGRQECLLVTFLGRETWLIFNNPVIEFQFLTHPHIMRGECDFINETIAFVKANAFSFRKPLKSPNIGKFLALLLNQLRMRSVFLNGIT